MILDAQQMFDLPDAPRDLAQVAGSYASTNILDYGVIDGIPSEANGGGARDMGIGHYELKIFVQVITAFAGGTSLQVSFQGSIDDGSGGVAAWTTWMSSAAIADASLTAGNRIWRIDFPRPPAGIAIPRFCRLLYTTLGTHTAGTVVAGVVLDRDDQPFAGTNSGVLGGYPAGITVAN